MYETEPLLDGEQAELQDLDLFTFFDNFAAIDNNSNTTQPPSATLSEFEAQIQAIFSGNNDYSNSGQNQNFSNNVEDFNNFQYSVPTPPDNALFSSPDILASLSSPDSFLNSPNSNSLSPQFNNLQDFIVSSNDVIMKDSNQYSMEESLFDQLVSPVSPQQVDRKRVNSAFDRDSVSPDKSLKKKRKGLNGSISKSTKRPSIGLKSSGSPEVTLGEQLIKDEPTLVSNMMCNDGTTQSIIVPSSPVVPSELPSNFTTRGAMLSFNQGSWNQTINPSATNFVPEGITEASSQFTNMPLLVRDGSSTAKIPINRLKSTITNTQPQQNIQSQPNKQQKKVAHNAIERRYRNNINDRINDLKNVVPALCHLKSKDSKDDEEVDEVDGIPAATKLNKATILRKATEYITYLKTNNQKVKRENEALMKLIEALPGGIDLYNIYMAECNEPDIHTPPKSVECSPGSSPPCSPKLDYDTPPTPPVGSRALMALFMCMTFFTSPSSNITQSHLTDHHHEGRVLTSSSTPIIEKNSLDVNDGVLTIDLWYLARMFTFLICLTYILRPSLFSFQSRRSRKSNSIIISAVNYKTKDAKGLYLSLSSLANGLPANIFETIIGIISEFIKFSLRRLLGWDVMSGYTHADHEERSVEVALWGRIGEVELCGGNEKVSRLSILYTCLRTINLLESSYMTRKHISLSSSRIYANAAIQSYIGLSSFPFLAGRVVAHFYKLANKEKVLESGTGEKWLEIALNCDQRSEMWKQIVNRIRDSIFEKSHNELMKEITIPLTLVADVQALNYLKQAFYNFITTKHGGKKKSSSSKIKQSFSFIELVRDTTPNSFTHWYALVGCCIEAFHLGHNKLGENLVNRLKDYPRFKSNENTNDKQIIAMGLLSYALLMQGKLEASLRCANKASIALTQRKEQRNGDDSSLEELNNYSLEIEQDIHYLTEFCVGWIVLEAKSLGWKIVEGLSSSMNVRNNNTLNDTTKQSTENENEDENKTTSTTTKTSTTSTTTSALNNKLPNMLDSERLQSAITLWSRYLRRLSKNLVFEDITKVRYIFIKKLVVLESIVGGDYENNDDKENGEDNNTQQHNGNEGTPPLSESEIRATKAWSILKGM
ncbi:hypothetical protein RclHR1_08590005 [Rhizophagus clarus]|uniref:Helix-loop-helix DNA-binding domain-containing transcription factor n=1 Tax=Rhizophagus clarus TaxID=94130 RepID=A0A2Z6S1I8_9GLOM|nr:hypothetical protein RclHR1_08590005 [Rhizophagus clarus]GES89321.1 helix-loop-helix DNA-binding domain-containing transcription factor [Rhizophagus clarus]